MVAARIGLTRAGVAPLADELLRAGLLVETARAATGGRGRPGSELAVSDRGPAGIGAEIGVDHLAVCAVDLRGRVRARAAVGAANRHSAPGPVLRRLSALLAEVTEEIAADGLRPAGLAVAVPGLVARGSTTVVHAPNLGWRAADLAPGLTGATAPGDGSRTLPLTVENEANLGALAELRLGRDDGPCGPAAGLRACVGRDRYRCRGRRGRSTAAGGTGVRGGAGACAGVSGRPGVRLRRPGLSGAVRGGRGRAARGRAHPERAAAAHPGPGARIGLLARRAADGDAAVVRALHEAGTALGIALAGAVNLLDPQAVVLGGALAGLAPWILPSLERELALRTTVAADSGRVGGPLVTVSRLGADGPLLGAAHAALQAVLDDPLHSGAPAHSPRN